MFSISRSMGFSILTLSVALFLLPASYGDIGPLLGENADWQPQDYVDSRGIVAVRLENGRLVFDAHLVGQHPNYSKGEGLLDLRYFPGLECQVPIDLSQSKITVEGEVPEEEVRS
ncbi:hypothetical protein HYR99_24055 [Candidatus Poribacteria bacterium]|nr:hypothetical protein [Candidatus Poribacteria bacterium]